MLPGLGVTPDPPLGEYCRLRDRNERVMKLQRFMTTTFPSYNLYRPTGFYGLATKDGVAEFQRRTGITGPDANGEIVGPRTLRELKKFGFAP
jgi:peptidoglycan hydrolase-like protein with peptidoglycan-binding domain